MHLDSSYLLLSVGPILVAAACHRIYSWADWTLAEGEHDAVVHAVCFAQYDMPRTGQWNTVSACYLQLAHCQQLRNEELTQKPKGLVLLTHQPLSSEPLLRWRLRSEQIR